MTRPRFEQYGRTIRVEGGLKARSSRGEIGQSWWSRRFLEVLESFALGSRLTRGRSYARAGQVLDLHIAPGVVTASVQGSRPRPYQVQIRLDELTEASWTRVTAALAQAAIFSARLLAGEMPTDIETVFTDAGAPLFPTSAAALRQSCSCPDFAVPCKHIAATFYLLAEAFDDDPFQILHWRGRDRETLLARLRSLRGAGDDADPAGAPAPAARRGRRARASSPSTAGPDGGGTTDSVRDAGTAAALAGVTIPALADAVDRFWYPPVPLPPRAATLVTQSDLLLRQLPTPPAILGGPELVTRLREIYQDLTIGPVGADQP